MSRDVASNGRPPSCVGLSGEARPTESMLMRKWDGKRKENKTGVWWLKWDALEKKNASRRWKINPGRKMRGERGENGWERQRGRVRRRKGLLTEYRGPWGDGWSELSGTTIHQTSRGGEKKRGDKHTPQKSELQRILKMCSGLWKKGKKVLVDLVFERVANHNRIHVVFSEWIKGPLGYNFLKDSSSTSNHCAV